MDTGIIYEDALRLWRSVTADDLKESAWPGASAAGSDGLLLCGENLKLMATLAEQIGSGLRAPVNLIYMDPPYFSNRDLESHIKYEIPIGESGEKTEKIETTETIIKEPAFSDKWMGKGYRGAPKYTIEVYLEMLTPRIVAAHELLADDGAMWIHLDRRAVHYARVMADVVFGSSDHLVNEVVWSYKSGGASTRRFSNKHDTLLYYVKNKRKYKFSPQEEKSYNRGLKPYRFKGVKEYRDDHGWYTIVNMKDVWEIPMVGRTAAERTGYATQKPEALIERIVLSCTEEGDVCLDPFGGSGTLAAVCARNGRGWISIDENPTATEIAAKRLGML